MARVITDLSAGFVDAELLMLISFCDVIENAAVELVVGVGGENTENLRINGSALRDLSPVRQTSKRRRIVVDINDVNVNASTVTEACNTIVHHDRLENNVILARSL